MVPEHEGDQNGNKIGYTVKELLNNLNVKIDKVIDALEKKIDRNEYEMAHDTLVAKVLVVETKMATNEALKAQQEQLSQIYLRQWEVMQSDIQKLKTDQAASSAVSTAVQKEKNDWKILWIPIIANAIAVVAVIYFTIVRP